MAFRLTPTLKQVTRNFSTSRVVLVQNSLIRSAAVAKPYVSGTVNDPTTFPAPNKAHGSYHWAFERYLSAALVPLVGATAVTSAHPVLDGLLAVGFVVHTHLGFDNILTDYLHPRKFPILGNIAMWTVRIATGGVLVGVYQFNTNDIGLTELIKKVWKA